MNDLLAIAIRKYNASTVCNLLFKGEKISEHSNDVITVTINIGVYIRQFRISVSL